MTELILELLLVASFNDHQTQTNKISNHLNKI
jgi:hypothetical protein